MFTVKMTNFRCFGDTGDVEVRPLTFLVGENSAGKTSFLAGLRQLLESFTEIPKNAFNREPYSLGSFDQIAYTRGGRGGRATAFSLAITSRDGRLSPGLPREEKGGSFAFSHRFVFTKGNPQTELCSYHFSTSNLVADVSFSNEVPEIKVTQGEKSRTIAPLNRVPGSEFFRGNMHFIPYLFDSVAFRATARKPSTADAKDIALSEDVARRFRGSTPLLQRRTFASAPVRTEPLRTYTPSEITPSSLGAHVPLELARQKAIAPEGWRRVKTGLVDFGRNSGLFEDIDVRQLGKKDGDPFQVLVKIKGPSVTLLDVGYGVSQALPIIYQIQNSASYDTFLLQQPEVHLHPRAQAELGTLIGHSEPSKRGLLYVIETHSDYMIDRVRINIMEGKIASDDVSIAYFERTKQGVQVHNLHIDAQGQIVDAPPSFRSFFLKEQGRMLGL